MLGYWASLALVVLLLLAVQAAVIAGVTVYHLMQH